MGDRQAKKSITGRDKSGPYRSFALVPVPVDERFRRATMPMQPLWWQRFTEWIAYYRIQLRWDIERRASRLFHRRWGG